MGIYVNDNGTPSEAGIAPVNGRNVLLAYAGDAYGAPVKVYDFSRFIEYAEVRITELSYDGSAVDTETFNAHGALTINETSQYIQISTSERGHSLGLTADLFLHLKPSAQTTAAEWIVSGRYGGALPFLLSVTGRVSSSGSAYQSYANYSFSEPVVDGSYSGSKTATRVFSHDAPGQLGYACWLLTEKTSGSGTASNRMTFNALQISGEDIPIRITNSVT